MQSFFLRKYERYSNRSSLFFENNSVTKIAKEKNQKRTSATSSRAKEWQRLGVWKPCKVWFVRHQGLGHKPWWRTRYLDRRQVARKLLIAQVRTLISVLFYLFYASGGLSCFHNPRQYSKFATTATLAVSQVCFLRSLRLPLFVCLSLRFNAVVPLDVCQDMFVAVGQGNAEKLTEESSARVLARAGLNLPPQLLFIADSLSLC